MGYRGYLVETGWDKSYKNKKPLDRKGDPIPWVTLPFIRFVETRINSYMRIFEYGSGNSTAYYAKRVKEVVSVEHDKEWFEIVKCGKPQNSEITHIELSDEYNYQQAIRNYGRIEVVIVDGRRRNECVFNSVNSISENGVIVLDDSLREEYTVGIDFYGVDPGQSWEKNIYFL